MGEKFTDRTFIDELVELDGKYFERCTFDGCLLVYRYGPTFVIDFDCNFIDTEYRNENPQASRG